MRIHHSTGNNPFGYDPKFGGFTALLKGKDGSWSRPTLSVESGLTLGVEHSIVKDGEVKLTTYDAKLAQMTLDELNSAVAAVSQMGDGKATKLSLSDLGSSLAVMEKSDGPLTLAPGSFYLQSWKDRDPADRTKEVPVYQLAPGEDDTDICILFSGCKNSWQPHPERVLSSAMPIARGCVDTGKMSAPASRKGQPLYDLATIALMKPGDTLAYRCREVDGGTSLEFFHWDGVEVTHVIDGTLEEFNALTGREMVWGRDCIYEVKSEGSNGNLSMSSHAA